MGIWKNVRTKSCMKDTVLMKRHMESSKRVQILINGTSFTKALFCAPSVYMAWHRIIGFLFLLKTLKVLEQNWILAYSLGLVMCILDED